AKGIKIECQICAGTDGPGRASYAAGSNKTGNRNLQRHLGPVARFRSGAETPCHVVRSRPIQGRCRLRPRYKGAQDIAGRPRAIRASWTIELRKKGIPARHPVITGKRSETTARRRFSFLSGNVSAPSQTKGRSARSP